MFEGLTIEHNVPLAQFTTFKIGGPAQYFLRAKSVAEVLQALRVANEHNVPVFVLGGGSDILVHDKGFQGLVIKMEINEIHVDGTYVTAGAGTLINAVIGQAVRAGLGGLEFATGVPASVGGAVWANLGSRGSDISHVVQTVHCINQDGTLLTLHAQDCQFGYRESIFKHKPYIILDVIFQLVPGDKDALRKRMVELSKLKKTEQNVGQDTAGCAFRNPVSDAPEKQILTAAQCIDQLGLKGFSIGGAQVSNQHANFIINTGGATADDVVQLISYIKQQVRDTLGIQLMEEVEYVGFTNSFTN